MADAVQAVPGTDPDRASYQAAVETAQNLVSTARNVTGDFGRAVLAALHPARRPRVCPRRVKSPLSRWNKHPPGKPTTTKTITAITTAISHDHQAGTTHHQKSVTIPAGP